MTFDDFVRARLPALLRFAKVLCGDRGTAEDVVQEVLLRTQSRWDALADREAPEAYVRRMIVNEYLSWRRKWARVVPHADVPAASLVAPDSSGRVADRDLLAGEIARLPRRQRAVVVMRYFADLSDVEIAVELGCSAVTVRSHLSRALKSLRVHIEDQEIDKVGEVNERLAN